MSNFWIETACQDAINEIGIFLDDEDNKKIFESWIAQEGRDIGIGRILSSVIVNCEELKGLINLNNDTVFENLSNQIFQFICLRYPLLTACC